VPTMTAVEAEGDYSGNRISNTICDYLVNLQHTYWQHGGA
jgi:hypothetical protein